MIRLHWLPCTSKPSPTGTRPPPSSCARAGARTACTLANLSKWPKGKIDTLRRLLKDEPLVGRDDAFDIVRSLPHGHVAAVLGTLRTLRLDRLIDPAHSPQRERVLAMVAARILDPGSKLATARGLAEATARDSLTLGLGPLDEDDLYASMDWLLERQDRIERGLAKRHLGEGVGALRPDVGMDGGTDLPAGHSRDGKRGKLRSTGCCARVTDVRCGGGVRRQHRRPEYGGGAGRKAAPALRALAGGAGRRPGDAHRGENP